MERSDGAEYADGVRTRAGGVEGVEVGGKDAGGFGVTFWMLAVFRLGSESSGFEGVERDGFSFDAGKRREMRKADRREARKRVVTW